MKTELDSHKFGPLRPDHLRIASFLVRHSSNLSARYRPYNWQMYELAELAHPEPLLVRTTGLLPSSPHCRGFVGIGRYGFAALHGDEVGDVVKLTTERINNNKLLLYTQKTGTPVCEVLPGLASSRKPLIVKQFCLLNQRLVVGPD